MLVADCDCGHVDARDGKRVEVEGEHARSGDVAQALRDQGEHLEDGRRGQEPREEEVGEQHVGQGAERGQGIPDLVDVEFVIVIRDLFFAIKTL